MRAAATGWCRRPSGRAGRSPRGRTAGRAGPGPTRLREADPRVAGGGRVHLRGVLVGVRGPADDDERQCGGAAVEPVHDEVTWFSGSNRATTRWKRPGSRSSAASASAGSVEDRCAVRDQLGEAPNSSRSSRRCPARRRSAHRPSAPRSPPPRDRSGARAAPLGTTPLEAVDVTATGSAASDQRQEDGVGGVEQEHHVGSSGGECSADGGVRQGLERPLRRRAGDPLHAEEDSRSSLARRGSRRRPRGRAASRLPPPRWPSRSRHTAGTPRVPIIPIRTSRSSAVATTDVSADRVVRPSQSRATAARCAP